MHELFAKAEELLAGPAPGMRFAYVGESRRFDGDNEGWDEADSEFHGRHQASVDEMTAAWGPPRFLSFETDFRSSLAGVPVPEIIDFLTDWTFSAAVWMRGGLAVATTYGQYDRELPFELVVAVGSLAPVDTSLTGLLQEWVRWLDRLGIPSVPKIEWTWPEDVHAWRKNTTVPAALREWFGWFAGSVGEACPGWDFVPYSPHTGNLIPLLRGEAGVLAAHLTTADDDPPVALLTDSDLTPAYPSITALAQATLAGFLTGD